MKAEQKLESENEKLREESQKKKDLITIYVYEN